MQEKIFMSTFLFSLFLIFILYILIKFIKIRNKDNSFNEFENKHLLTNYYKRAFHILHKAKVLFFVPFFFSVFFSILSQISRFYLYYKYYPPGSDTKIITTLSINHQFITSIMESPKKLLYGYTTSLHTKIFYGLFIIGCILFPFFKTKIKSFIKEANQSIISKFGYNFMIVLLYLICRMILFHLISVNIITLSETVIAILNPLLTIFNYLVFCVAFTLFESFLLNYTFCRISDETINFRQIIEHSIEIYPTFFKYNLIVVSFSLLFMGLSYLVELYGGFDINIQLIPLSFLKLITYLFSTFITITLLPAPFILVINRSNLKDLANQTINFILGNLKKYVVFIIIGIMLILVPEFLMFIFRLIFRFELTYMILSVIEPIFTLFLSVIFYLAFFQFILNHFGNNSGNYNAV